MSLCKFDRHADVKVQALIGRAAHLYAPPKRPGDEVVNNMCAQPAATGSPLGGVERIEYFLQPGLIGAIAVV